MHPLTRRIADVLALQPDAQAIEYNGDWSTWHQISEFAKRIAVVGDTQVGILLRNSPAHVAALLGVLLGGSTVVTINPSRGDDRTRDDIVTLDLPIVVGTPDDLAALVPDGPALIPLSSLDDPPQIASVETRAGRPGVAVRMLTSGTTGPPKRIDLTYDMLARSVITSPT